MSDVHCFLPYYIQSCLNEAQTVIGIAKHILEKNLIWYIYVQGDGGSVQAVVGPKKSVKITKSGSIALIITKIFIIKMVAS